LGGLFMGMQLMQASLAPFGVTVAQRLFPAAQNTGPLNAIGIGVVVTLMLQSSSAVTGIVIAMVGSGILDPRLGIFITLGANIGTVGTSLLASVGMNSLAKKAALTDLLLNLVAVLCVLPWFDKFHHLVVLCSPRASAQIANAHTMFNIAASTLALPFVPVIAKLVDAE
ncbi:MAG: Na/Pi cotransporter family protein, partial [Firmicutes bacterium]|nr:Na/Pi cotransporter family protein [Bacillota bacterium]